MKQLILFCATVSILSQALWATPRADSIVAFTGGRTKLVWLRQPWCNDSYQPQSKAYMSANQSVVFFDTDVGVEKTLDKGSPNISFLRISRSGRWVTWNDLTNKKTYIIDVTAATPAKTVLLDNASRSYWCVRAFWVDQPTGMEYVYCLDNYGSSGGNGIYKVPLNANGTADVSKAAKLYSAASIDDPLSVSQDGKKIGAAIPWPTTGLIDVATGRFDVRHDGQFGCQANLAPDNSLRFFHCLDEHQGVQMYDANMSATHWAVDFRATAPGWTCAEGTPDFAAPRWTNSPLYISNTYPMINNYLDGDCPCWGGVDIWSLDAAGVKSRVRQDLISNFFIAKFSSGYKTVEKTLMIAADLRYFQYGGDAWMCNGVVAPGTNCTTVASQSTIREDRNVPGMDVVRNRSLWSITSRNDALMRVRLTDAQGRQVRQVTGSGSVAVDTRNMANGAYVISVSQGTRRLTQQVTVTK